MEKINHFEIALRNDHTIYVNAKLKDSIRLGVHKIVFTDIDEVIGENITVDEDEETKQNTADDIVKKVKIKPAIKDVLVLNSTQKWP